MKLGEVAQIVDCEHKTAPIDENGAYFAVGTSAMRGNVINYREARRISKNTFDAWTKRITPKAGDVLFAREAPVGPVVEIPAEENVAPGQRTVLIRATTDAVQRFIAYKLKEPLMQNQIEALSAGSTVPHLNVKDIRELELGYLPTLASQHAIADVLGALDDKIAANIRVKETCTELIKAIGSIPNSNIPVSELAVQVKKQISAGKLQELDVRHYSIPAFDLGYASIESGAEIKSGKNLIEAPCVLVSKLNPRTPRIWSIPTVHSEETTVCSTEFIAWQGTTVPQAALYAALLQGSFSEQLQERASGTSNSHQRVRPQDIQEATIPDVRKLDQETLKLLEALNLQAADLIKENQALARTRDELLPLLMNGKITVAEAKEAAGDVGVVKQNQQEEGDSSV